MEEEKPKELPVEEEKEDKPDVQETEDLISKANAAAARQEAANKELALLLARQEKLKVEETLSGTAKAGTTKRQTKDEKQIADARKMLEGTGYEDELFPVK